MKSTLFKFLSFAFLSLLSLSSCGESQSEIDSRKAKEFKRKFSEINESTPEDLSLLFYDRIENADDDSPFNHYTPAMIRSQEATFYKLAAEDHAKLIIDILVYKKLVGNKKVPVNIIQSKIYDLDKNDPIDKIALKSFEFMERYERERLEREPDFGY